MCNRLTQAWIYSHCCYLRCLFIPYVHWYGSQPSNDLQKFWMFSDIYNLVLSLSTVNMADLRNKRILTKLGLWFLKLAIKDTAGSALLLWISYFGETSCQAMRTLKKPCRKRLFVMRNCMLSVMRNWCFLLATSTNLPGMWSEPPWKLTPHPQSILQMSATLADILSTA